MRNGSNDPALEKEVLLQLTTVSSLHTQIRSRLKEVESLIQEYENTGVINPDGLLVRKNLETLSGLLEQKLETINTLIEELKQVEHALEG